MNFLKLLTGSPTRCIQFMSVKMHKPPTKANMKSDKSPCSVVHFNNSFILQEKILINLFATANYILALCLRYRL